MKTAVRKSGFVLAPYMKSNNLRATYQILNTVVPYALLWILAVKAASVSLWFMPPIIVLMILFSVRCFSLMHDCGHYSLFSSKKVNRVIGFMLGVINAIPQYSWSRDHDYHHKTNGDWQRYRGVADFLSIEEFSKLNSFNQRLYELLRHPLMAFPGGFFYLAIKPRLALIVGTYDFINYLFTEMRKDSSVDLAQAISSHKSKYWQTAAEFWDLLFNNICVVGSWIFLGYLLGFGFFLAFIPSCSLVLRQFSSGSFLYSTFLMVLMLTKQKAGAICKERLRAAVTWSCRRFFSGLPQILATTTFIISPKEFLITISKLVIKKILSSSRKQRPFGSAIWLTAPNSSCGILPPIALYPSHHFVKLPKLSWIQHKVSQTEPRWQILLKRTLQETFHGV